MGVWTHSNLSKLLVTCSPGYMAIFVLGPPVVLISSTVFLASLQCRHLSLSSDSPSFSPVWPSYRPPPGPSNAMRTCPQSLVCRRWPTSSVGVWYICDNVQAPLKSCTYSRSYCRIVGRNDTLALRNCSNGKSHSGCRSSKGQTECFCSTDG